MSEKTEAAAAVASKVLTGGSYSAAAGNMFMGLTQSDIQFAVGLGIGVGTFAVNWYYKHQNLKIQRRNNCNKPLRKKGENNGN